MMRQLLIVLLAISISACSRNAIPDEMDLDELTVTQIHAAYLNGDYNAEQLTKTYIKRIKLLDQSTGLNAIVIIDPSAIEQARELDHEFEESGVLRPLHGIPLIVKDNYNTVGLQTAAGSIALKGFEPSTDAFQVRKLKEAGVIIIAKSNMAEWAFSPRHTESSFAGTTRNPYNLDYVPAGSSGGTGAGVAANFGTLGLGTDTGNSIRGPSSHNALVGFRSTLGLTSREGIVPLFLRNDVGGPMCRTVEDATKVLEIIAGHDVDDPITSNSLGNVPENYQQFLDVDGLIGARIGVLHIISDADVHHEIDSLFSKAITDIEALGATVVDPFPVADFQELRQNQWCPEFPQDITDYLNKYVKWDSLQTYEDIVAYGGYSGYAETIFQYYEKIAEEPRPGECLDAYSDKRRIAFREAIESAMDEFEIDAVIYPSWNHPPSLIDDFMDGYKGDNSQIIAPHTGQPAFTVPMGYTTGDLPAGLQFLGRMFDEPTLIRLTYAYEQGTLHRKPPKLAPDLAKLPKSN